MRIGGDEAASGEPASEAGRTCSGAGGNEDTQSAAQAATPPTHERTAMSEPRVSQERLEEAIGIRQARPTWSGEPQVGFDVELGSMLDLRDARSANARLRARCEALEKALRTIRDFDDTWSHRGHKPSEAGHECRMCWIMKTVDAALAGKVGDE